MPSGESDMSDTAGFEVVAELTKAVLQQILEAAYDNSIIPHSIDITAGLMFGPYRVASGVVNIPEAGLILDMAPADNGVAVTLPASIQIQIANPPIPSATLFDMTAIIVVTMPLGVLPGTIKVAAMLSQVVRNKVVVTLTSGDPVPPITMAAIREFVHQKYVDNTIPHTVSQNDVTFGPYTADVWVDVYDDASKPNHQITVSQPAPGKVKVLIPIHLRLSDVSGGAPSPMGVVAKIAVTADLITAPGSITANLATANVEVENFAAAPPADEGIDYDSEGSNYNLANTFTGGALETLLKNQIRTRGQAIAAGIGNIVVVVPTVSQIETFIGDQAHAALITRGDIGLWTPEPPAGGGVSVTNVTPKALAVALAIGLNDPGGADPNALTDFIPASRSCAIAISGAKVLQIIDETIHRPESAGGFGPSFPPKTFHNVDGHDARLTSLSISLRTGSIHLEGDVTVVDAIAGSIDVDASFEAAVGLEWQDGPSGTQIIHPFTISSDVDLSVLAWIISFLLGFITLGLIGGIIALVVVTIVEGIAERIGGAVIRDEVTGQIKGIGAWPQTLEGIGTVTSRFENPIAIDPGGIMFPDAYLVTSTFSLTVKALAEANGPYVVPGGSLLTLVGGPAAPDTQYKWDFDDGGSANLAIATHSYADNGIYVAKLTTKVNQPGGVTTRHFALVRVANVPPQVNAGSDLVIDEGQEVDFIATFTDAEWPDTHTAVFYFGDAAPPVIGTVNETNVPPHAQGTARAKHAYCDNGVYTLTVIVRDDDGGFGADTRRVTVRNVPPTVDAGEDMFAYPCTPITLLASFTDPGWCDTHTGTWEFGDCTPPHPAIIRERHEPPRGTGIAAAAHIYAHCGTYLAVCTVIDDDGGVGSDSIIVRVVDVLNRDFEGGFRNRLVGEVANAWEPYVTDGAAKIAPVSGAFVGTTTLFNAEEFVVHGGQRAQRIGGAGAFHAGIYQPVGANPDWDYQVSAWYHLDERAAGRCRLGVDPTGGVDPAAANVVWSEGQEHKRWAQLAVRVTAKQHAVTIFLETISEDRGAVAYFDDVALIAYPCPLCDKQPPVPPHEKAACVDWKEEHKPRQIGIEYQKNGFTFRSLAQQPLQIVIWGVPPNQGKFLIPQRGLQIELPFAADRVVAHVALYTGQPIMIKAFDDSNQKVGEAVSTLAQGAIQALEIVATGITNLVFIGGGGEGLLIDLCAYRQVSGKDASPTTGEEIVNYQPGAE